MDGESEILLNCNWIWPVLEVTYRLIVNSNLIIFILLLIIISYLQIWWCFDYCAIMV